MTCIVRIYQCYIVRTNHTHRYEVVESVCLKNLNVFKLLNRYVGSEMVDYSSSLELDKGGDFWTEWWRFPILISKRVGA